MLCDANISFPFQTQYVCHIGTVFGVAAQLDSCFHTSWNRIGQIFEAIMHIFIAIAAASIGYVYPGDLRFLTLSVKY